MRVIVGVIMGIAVRMIVWMFVTVRVVVIDGMRMIRCCFAFLGHRMLLRLACVLLFVSVAEERGAVKHGDLTAFPSAFIISAG